MYINTLALLIETASFVICFNKHADILRMSALTHKKRAKILCKHNLGSLFMCERKRSKKSFRDYFNVTTAPTSSNCFLRASASSLEIPSLTTLGAPSTTSLASLSPKPVASLTALITLTF